LRALVPKISKVESIIILRDYQVFWSTCRHLSLTHISVSPFLRWTRHLL
jgi:hypothetical protein